MTRMTKQRRGRLKRINNGLIPAPIEIEKCLVNTRMADEARNVQVSQVGVQKDRVERGIFCQEMTAWDPDGRRETGRRTER